MKIVQRVIENYVDSLLNKIESLVEEMEDHDVKSVIESSRVKLRNKDIFRKISIKQTVLTILKDI